MKYSSAMQAKGNNHKPAGIPRRRACLWRSKAEMLHYGMQHVTLKK